MTDPGNTENPQGNKNPQDKGKGAFGWYKPPEENPLQKNDGSGSQNASPRAIFDTPAFYRQHPELWDLDANLRMQRFNDIFYPSVQRLANNLSEEGKIILQKLVGELQDLASEPYEVVKDNWGFDIVVIDEKDNRRSYMITPEELDPYDEHELSAENVKIADTFLKGLMPELGIGLEPSWDKVIEKVNLLRKSGYAAEYFSDLLDEFHLPTILPGVQVTYSQGKAHGPNGFIIGVEPAPWGDSRTSPANVNK